MDTSQMTLTSTTKDMRSLFKVVHKYMVRPILLFAFNTVDLQPVGHDPAVENHCIRSPDMTWWCLKSSSETSLISQRCSCLRFWAEAKKLCVCAGVWVDKWDTLYHRVSRALLHTDISLEHMPGSCCGRWIYVFVSWLMSWRGLYCLLLRV